MKKPIIIGLCLMAILVAWFAFSSGGQERDKAPEERTAGETPIHQRGELKRGGAKGY